MPRAIACLYKEGTIKEGDRVRYTVTQDGLSGTLGLKMQQQEAIIWCICVNWVIDIGIVDESKSNVALL